MQDIISDAMLILLICFVVSTGIMYLAAKVRGYNPDGIHVKSKWSMNLDIKFFSDLRKNYIALGKPKIIPIINIFSIYGLFAGWILIIVAELLKYY